MKELFELDSERVQPAARLIEDLELDSLDAFDLAVKVEEITGIAFDENKIRDLVTVDDVVNAIHGGLSASGSTWPVAAQTDP